MADDWGRYLTEQQGGWSGDALDWGLAFGKSALESIPEIIGIKPSEDTLRYRANSPIGGFVSELLGMAVPYGMWAKGLSVAAKAGIRGATALEGLATGGAGFEARLASNPFLTGARAEAVRFAPFEAGRLAISQVVGDKSFGEMAFETSLNLGGAAAIGGGVAKLGGLVKRPTPLREAIPGVDDSTNPQLLLRELTGRAVAQPELAPEVAKWVPDLELAARSETVPKGSVYVHPEVSGPKDELERLFEPGKTGPRDVDTLRPVAGQGTDTFPAEADWQGIFEKVGASPEDVASKMQYPRVVQVNPAHEMNRAAEGRRLPNEGKTLKDAEWLEQSITKNMAPVGDGWFMVREPNDGMFVMAKKTGGESPRLLPGKAGPGDQWVLFKTDMPGDFAKSSQEFMNASIARERWIAGRPAVEDLAKDPGPVGALVKMATEDFPKQRYTEMAARVGAENVGGLAAKLAAPLSRSALAQEVGDFVRSYIAPALHQFKSNPVANRTYNMGLALQDGADMFWQGVFGGAKEAREGKSLLRGFVVKPDQADLEQLWTRAQSEGVFRELVDLRRKQIGADEAARLAMEKQISPKTAEIARKIEDSLRFGHEENQKAAVAAGRNKVEFTNNYGLPLQWEGDFLKAVRDEGGVIRGVAAGGSPRAASLNAEKLAKQLATATGGKYRPAEAFTLGADPKGLPADAAKILQDPKRAIGEQGVRGFKWDLEEPTLPDVLKEVKGWTESQGRKMGTDLREAVLSPDIAQVMAENGRMAGDLIKRFEQMSGRQGEFAKAQNKFADKILSPYLGANSANKLAAINNTTLTHQTLGAFKLGAPIQNVLSVFQTVLPESAFLMNGGEAAHVAAYGITAPAMGSKGAVGSVSVLDPLKALWQGFRTAMNPDKEMRTLYYNRAINDRILDAQAAENYIGQNRRTLAGWRNAIDSPKALGQFMLAASEWLLLHSDRFARTLAFTTAVQIQRNWHGVTDPEVIYQVAKRLVERTNYNYSSSARPLVFTGPVGSSLGLFKNWQMNFIAGMVEYGGFGLKRGVWSPLIWQTMSTAALGGVAATPLYWAANAASNFFAQKRLTQYAYDEWGKGADGVMFGLPAALTGVSLSGLMSSPGANPVKDATQMFSFAAWQRMADTGALVKAAMDNWRATGQHPASDPDVRNNLAKAFAPVLMQRAMAIDWESGTVKSLATGMPSTKGLSVFDLLTYQAGLQPTAIARQLEATNILWEDKQKMMGATKAYGDAVAEAFAKRDSGAANMILLRAMSQGVDVSSVLRSGTQRFKNDQQSSAERLAKPATLLGVQNLINPR